MISEADLAKTLDAITNLIQDDESWTELSANVANVIELVLRVIDAVGKPLAEDPRPYDVVAIGFRNFVAALERQGFTREEAMSITLGTQASLAAAVKK